MEEIGSQVKLPLNMAVQITLQGIRIRLGRALVTLSGVVLGIAFLMSVLTGSAIKDAVSKEQDLRQTVTLMRNLVKSEIGDVDGKRVAVAGFGRLSPAETRLLQEIAASKPAQVRGYGIPTVIGGITRANSPAGIGNGACLLLVLGDGKNCNTSLAEMGKGMTQPVALDSLARREYASGASGEVRRELFFGTQAELEKQKMASMAENDRFRRLWILVVSLLVTVISISNAMLMSVTERFKEIGTMKCLGALSSFIRRLFLVESALIGFTGSIIGVLLGIAVPLVAYGSVYGFPLVMGSLNYGSVMVSGFWGLGAGTALSMIAAIYPANIAARMVPAMALRSNI